MTLWLFKALTSLFFTLWLLFFLRLSLSIHVRAHLKSPAFLLSTAAICKRAKDHTNTHTIFVCLQLKISLYKMRKNFQAISNRENIIIKTTSDLARIVLMFVWVVYFDAVPSLAGICVRTNSYKVAGFFSLSIFLALPFFLFLLHAHSLSLSLPSFLIFSFSCRFCSVCRNLFTRI